jgi:hypothetical protein
MHISNPATHCAECAYLQAERAAIHMDSHLPEPKAIAAAASERCHDHSPQQRPRSATAATTEARV